MLKRTLQFMLFFSCLVAFIFSCSLDSNQWAIEENTDNQLTRASGNMLNLITTQISWGISDRDNPRRIYYESRDRYAAGAIYGGTDFYPVGYWAEPYPGHYRVDPVYTGVARYDYNDHAYWYRFYSVIKLRKESSLSHQWTNISVYYYDENDEPYENEYLIIWVC
ncbi:MAG: hypothetical protein JXB88_14875 [Spirochaetales bacterium]|nr:hypothetical protein [Spirochaetales bacterium]